MVRAMDKTSSGSVMRSSPGAEDLSLLFRVVDGMQGKRNTAVVLDFGDMMRHEYNDTLHDSSKMFKTTCRQKWADKIHANQ
jgi:hypothetical protein